MQSIHSIRKIHKIEKTLTSLFFRPTLEPDYYIEQNSVILSEFVINRSTVLKIFSPDNRSAIAHLNKWVMAELWITEYSDFMKDFLSITMKNIHPFHVFTIETYVCFYSNSQSVNSCYWIFQRLKRHRSKRIC